MRRIIVPVTLAVLAAGCARDAGPPAPAPRAPVVVTPGAPLPMPRSYVTTSSSVDRFMINAADLAQSRARDQRLRDFAAQLKRDHEAIAAQLSFAGRRLNLLPDGRLLNHHAERLQRLQAAGDFDAAYREEMLRTLEAALAHHRRFAQSGTSPTLRPVASFAAERIERNLRTLRSL